jgi:radical SAM protein with 4Fe4S-binding SPASM domain
LNKYFNLNPECFLVPGKSRSAVYNLNNGKIILLDQIQTKALIHSESKQGITESAEIYEYLAMKKWGFFSDHAVYIDKVRPTNIFRQRRFWLETPMFRTLIIQITQECNQQCKNCGKTFCPVCTSASKLDGRIHSVLTTEAWVAIIQNAAAHGVCGVLFTGGECLLYDGITQLISESINLGLSVSLQTNGRLSLDKIPQEVTISVLCNKDSACESIFENIANRRQVSILFQDMEPDKFMAEAKQGWIIRRISSQQSKIDKNTMSDCALDRFFYKKTRDPCLNGKMFVLPDGSIVPCFQKIDTPLGNLAHGDFTELYRLLIQQYWHASLAEQTQGKKCASCELVYACAACRFSDVENNCLYNPVKD